MLFCYKGLFSGTDEVATDKEDLLEELICALADTRIFLRGTPAGLLNRYSRPASQADHTFIYKSMISRMSVVYTDQAEHELLLMRNWTYRRQERYADLWGREAVNNLGAWIEHFMEVGAVLDGEILRGETDEFDRWDKVNEQMGWEYVT